MTKIHSVSDLLEAKEKYKKLVYTDKSKEGFVQIKVGMSTCGIASGAKEILQILKEECEQLAIDAQIKQTGRLGYCYAEPMVEVILPNSKPKVFGYVDKSRAKEIIEKYVLRNEPVDGEVFVSFKTIND